MNEVAVWPEGKEFLEDMSGLVLRTVYFNPLVTPAISAAEKTLDVANLPHFVIPETPHAFIPSEARPGRYWIYSSYEWLKPGVALYLMSIMSVSMDILV